MSEIDVLLRTIGYLIGLAKGLAAKAPDQAEAEKMIAARLRTQLERNALLDKVHNEDQAILDARIPPQ